MPEIKEELKEERRKEIKKIVDNEVNGQKAQLTDDQKNAIVALVDGAVDGALTDEALAASGGISRQALVNFGTHTAVAAISAALGAFGMYAVKKWGPKHGSSSGNSVTPPTTPPTTPTDTDASGNPQ